jgi:hypothetical protein
MARVFFRWLRRCGQAGPLGDPWDGSDTREITANVANPTGVRPGFLTAVKIINCPPKALTFRVPQFESYHPSDAVRLFTECSWPMVCPNSRRPSRDRRAPARAELFLRQLRVTTKLRVASATLDLGCSGGVSGH